MRQAGWITAAVLMMTGQVAFAEETKRFRVDATLTQDDEAIGTPSILLESGKSASIEVSNRYRMTVSVSPSDDRYLLNARIERPDGEGWTTVSTPMIRFGGGTASIAVTTREGLAVSIRVSLA